MAYRSKSGKTHMWWGALVVAFVLSIGLLGQPSSHAGPFDIQDKLKQLRTK